MKKKTAPPNLTPTRIALAMWRVAGAVDDARKLGIRLAVTIDVQGELESLRPLAALNPGDLARAFRAVQERRQGVQGVIADGSVEDLTRAVAAQKREQKPTKPRRRPMSEKGRASIRRKMRARWREAKRAGKNSLS